jgi:hypothetical protein
MATKEKRYKCLTCKHPLDEHTEDRCIHWNWDTQAICKCNEGSDGVPLNKVFEKIRVSEVVTIGKNFVWFKGNDGRQWRWMFKQKKLFPITVV